MESRWIFVGLSWLHVTGAQRILYCTIHTMQKRKFSRGGKLVSAFLVNLVKALIIITVVTASL